MSLSRHIHHHLAYHYFRYYVNYRIKSIKIICIVLFLKLMIMVVFLFSIMHSYLRMRNSLKPVSNYFDIFQYLCTVSLRLHVIESIELFQVVTWTMRELNLDKLVQIILVVFVFRFPFNTLRIDSTNVYQSTFSRK